ncbi:MAG: hypothetical protein LUE16_02720 [Lachnospiraceae bacterium]|nr:hypothetical protein [Lachnospiraceae bacterium]
MKRKPVVIWTLLLSLFLSGCGSTQANVEETETEQMEAVQTEEELSETTQTKEDQSEYMQTEDQSEMDTDTEENSEDAAAAEEEADKSGESGILTEWDAPVRIYGVISEVWVEQSIILVDNQSGNSSSGELELKINTASTLVLDATTGYPVSLEEVETGSFEAYLGQTMTLSLPPQASTYVIIVNIPEDSAAPQYAVVALVEEDAEGNVIITATDGRVYVVPETAQIVPYRTKNIVTVEDIRVGGACLIWMDEDGMASKVQLFDEAGQDTGDI